MAILYVDANYTVDDSGYFLDPSVSGLYWECDYVVYDGVLIYVDGDDACPVTTTATNKGDDAFADKPRGVRPLPRIRPKIERDLDDALEIIEAIAPERRVKENKASAKQALAAIREVQIPVSFAEPVEKIEKALRQLSLRTAKHEGMQQAAMRVAAELEAVIAEMERQRKRRQREEEAILWLLS